MYVKPDRDKVHHLFNGIRNNKVDQTTAMHGLEVEFNKAMAFIIAQEEQIELLGIEKDGARADRDRAKQELADQENYWEKLIGDYQDRVLKANDERDAAREERDHALKAKDKTLPKDKTRGKDPTTSGDPTLPTDPTLSDGTNRF